jgi:predicted dehydrogenase
VGNLLLSSQASWDYVNEHVELIGSNQTVLSVENGRQVRVFRHGENQPAQLYENTLSVHWWSGNTEQGFVPQLRAFAQSVLSGTAPCSGADDLCASSACLEDGMRSLALLEAIKSSVTQGVNVSLPSLSIAA